MMQAAPAGGCSQGGVGSGLAARMKVYVLCGVTLVCIVARPVLNPAFHPSVQIVFTVFTGLCLASKKAYTAALVLIFTQLPMISMFSK